MNELRKVNDFIPGRRHQFAEDDYRKWTPDIIEADFWDIARSMWDFTVLSLPAMYNIYSIVKYISNGELRGDIIECGVFAGGSIMLFEESLRRFERNVKRRIFALDTFSGFVSRTEHDVDYRGNEVCQPNPQRSSFREWSEANMRSIPFDQSRLIVVEGDVAKTIPSIPTHEVAVLRLDTDTYETTIFELEYLYPKIVAGGVVIIDDYGWNMGCKRAVDEYFSDKMAIVNRIDVQVRTIIKAG